MSDFHQNGLVTVLHRLGAPNLEQLEKRTRAACGDEPGSRWFSRRCIPGAREPRAQTHRQKSSRDIRYVNEIVISLDRASALEFRLAKQFFSVLPQRVRIVWNDGAAFRTSSNCWPMLNSTPDYRAKGVVCWMAFGYVLARGESNVIALRLRHSQLQSGSTSHGFVIPSSTPTWVTSSARVLQPGHEPPARPRHATVFHPVDSEASNRWLVPIRY